jgi:hypothetical protein
MVLCEAMLCGVPVVTLSTPLKDNSQLEVVGHGVGGLVALAPEAVPDAMVALIGDADLRASVRAGGASWVRERFAVGRISGRAIEIYEALLSGRPPERPTPDRRWIEMMLARGLGRRPTLADGLAFRALHTPLIYRAYLALARREAA